MYVSVSSFKIFVDDDVSFIENLPSYDCSSSEFCEPHYKHIVKIIKNFQFLMLISKGPNYQSQKCRTSVNVENPQSLLSH